MDRFLKHSRKLTRLNAGQVQYIISRPPPPSLSLPPISSRITQEPIHGGAANCMFYSGLYHLMAEEDEDVFRFMVPACPNLIDLTLRLLSDAHHRQNKTLQIH